MGSPNSAELLGALQIHSFTLFILEIYAYAQETHQNRRAPVHEFFPHFSGHPTYVRVRMTTQYPGAQPLAVEPPEFRDLLLVFTPIFFFESVTKRLWFLGK